MVRYNIILAIKQEGDSGYIMAKKYKRVLTLALVPFVAVNIYAGSKMINKTRSVSEKNLDTDYSISKEIGEPISDVDSVVTESTFIEEKFSESEFEKDTLKVTNKDPFNQLLELYKNSGLNYEDILGVCDRSDALYASALYQKLINSGLSQEEIEEQLNNVITMGCIFIDVDEFTWYNLFGKLQATLTEFDNPLDYYYPLAKYVHLATCKDEHKECYEDQERIYCDTIDKNLQTMNDGILLENYVLRELYYSQEPNVVQQVNRIYDNNLTLSDVFEELDRIYLLSMYPTDFDEETWKVLFDKLLTTVDERENVCSVYYDLACYIHMLTCDNDHTLNDFGTYECEPYRLKLGI